LADTVLVEMLASGDIVEEWEGGEREINEN
jgi:hypothetical protein